MSETSSFVSVQYEVAAPFNGKTVHQINVNYYFAYRGRWIDVHISVIEPNSDDLEIIDDFGRSLKYGSGSGG